MVEIFNPLVPIVGCTPFRIDCRFITYGIGIELLINVLIYHPFPFVKNTIVILLI